MVFPGWMLGHEFLVQRRPVRVGERQHDDIDGISQRLPIWIARQEFGETEGSGCTGNLVGVVSPNDKQRWFAEREFGSRPATSWWWGHDLDRPEWSSLERAGGLIGMDTRQRIKSHEKRWEIVSEENLLI